MTSIGTFPYTGQKHMRGVGKYLVARGVTLVSLLKKPCPSGRIVFVAQE